MSAAYRRKVRSMRTLSFVKNRWPLLLIAAVCAVLAAMADSVRDHETVAISLGYAVHAVAYLGLFLILTFAGERFLAWLGGRQQSEAEPNDSAQQDGGTQRTVGAEQKGGRQAVARVPLLTYRPNAKQFLIVLAIILACWLPYMLICYPGVIWYDTQQQLMQWFGLPNRFTDGSHLSDHHPVLDTAVFGVFTQFGGLLGSRDIGVFVYSVVQGVITASSLASVVVFCRSIGLSHRLCTFALWFFALFPVIPMYAIGMVKDSVFMPFFIWFAIVFVAVARSGGALLRQPKYLALLIGLGLCMSLTKKTGMYVALLSCLLLIFFLAKGNRIRAAVSAVVIGAMMMVVVPKMVFPALGIEEGGKQEMLAIPFQQSALLVKNHAQDIAQKDREAIYAVLGEDVGSRYQSWSADNVKGYTWNPEKNQYLHDYYLAWVRGGISHPNTYVTAYIALEEGWIGLPNAQDDNHGDLLMPVYALGSNHVFTGAEELDLHNPGRQQTVKSLEDTINWLEGTPLGMLLFSRAIWATWMVVFVIYECLRRDRRRMAWLLPYATTFLFLWISPATTTIEGMRYLIPLVFAAPLAFAVLLAPGNNPNGDSVSGSISGDEKH